MENDPMNRNQYIAQPYQQGASAPQANSMPPEIQKRLAKSYLRGADNRASLLLILLLILQFPLIFVAVIVWAFANKTQIRSILQSGGVQALMNYFNSNSALIMELSLIVTFIAMLIIILVGKPMLKRKVFGAWRKPQCGAATVLAGIVLMLGAAGAGSLLGDLVNFLFKQAGVSNGMTNLNLGKDPTCNAIMLAYICVIGPILEENLFRGMILQSLRPWGDWFAIVSSAILFGVFHLNLIQAIPATMMGLVLGFIAVKTESILPTILMHIVNNSLSMGFSTAGVDQNPTLQYIYYAILGAALLFTVVWIAVKRSEVAEVIARPSAAPHVQHKYSVFFFQSASFWVLAVFFVFYCVILAKSASGMIMKF